MLPPQPESQLSVDALRVLIFQDRVQAGAAAAVAVAQAIADRQKAVGRANVIFAAAPSQNDFLAGLLAHDVDWSRVYGFHMDEYLGLKTDHPASFRRYLLEHVFEPAKLKEDQLRLIPGERTDRPLLACMEYEEKLLREPTDVVCAGIGENGHIAFNDPPVADFEDPVLVKVVKLDRECRVQQVNDGCFATLEDVPTHAFTLTVPALLRAPVVSVVAVGPRKAQAVHDTIHGPISEACPSTVLRRHPGATLYLDRDSAKLIR